MLARYLRPEMKAIWSEENFFSLCLKVELLVAEAMASKGCIPQESLLNIKNKAKFDTERIAEIEKTTHHQFISFLSNVMENIGEDGRFLHLGLTSSDVLDTAFVLQLRQCADILQKDIEDLCSSLKDIALRYKYTPIIGRTHGIHAEPTTFGLVILGFYAEWLRNLERIKTAKEEVSVAAISGAVGNFANVDMGVEQYVAEKLGLRLELVSTQVIPRDRFAFFFAVLGISASSVERLATEIRHLQRTEVGEAKESFAKGQKGSSAMPHKSNPILSENLCGLSRIIRSAVVPAMEDVVLWHERDMSHSSVERFIAPDTTATLDFAIVRLTDVVRNLEVNGDRMMQNINLQKGLIFSQRVLLALIEKGMERDTAYKYVQSAAMSVWKGEQSFREALEGIEEISSLLSSSDLDNLFNLDYYTRRIDEIFSRVLGLD